MTQRTKQAAKKARGDSLREVKPLREVPRGPEHCGVPMRRMQNASVSSGDLLTIYSCDTCGAQMRPPAQRVT